MTPTRLRECLALLHWSQRGLADILGCPDTTTRRWATGKLPIPPLIAAWLETLAAAHEAAPPPGDWRGPRHPTADELDEG